MHKWHRRTACSWRTWYQVWTLVRSFLGSMYSVQAQAQHRNDHPCSEHKRCCKTGYCKQMQSCSTEELGLAGFVEIEMEPLESQKRGFTHGHRKVYGVYLMQIPVLTRIFCLAKKSITKQSNAKHSKAKQCIEKHSKAKPSKA